MDVAQPRSQILSFPHAKGKEKDPGSGRSRASFLQTLKLYTVDVFLMKSERLFHSLGAAT